MIDKQRLEAKCSTWNITLTGTQLDQLDAFAEILVDYNQKVNLTAITDPEGIEDKHFLDSLLFASQPEVAGRMVDVGAGAGFPGIVTKIFKPELELTLMEPTGKRVEFLKYACAQLGLTGVEFAKERAEEAARKRVAGAFGKGAQMGSKGATEGTGVQGSPTGNSSEGATAGTGGYGTFNLGGRSIGEGGLPRPVYNVQDEGRVVVTITVNPAGQVISTSINKRTNTVNAALRKAAEEAARKARFNQVDGVNNQTGTITYYFKLK